MSSNNSLLDPGKIVYYIRKTVEKNNSLDRTFVRFECNSVLFIRFIITSMLNPTEDFISKPVSGEGSHFVLFKKLAGVYYQV